MSEKPEFVPVEPHTLRTKPVPAGPPEVRRWHRAQAVHEAVADLNAALAAAHEDGLLAIGDKCGGYEPGLNQPLRIYVTVLHEVGDHTRQGVA